MSELSDQINKLRKLSEEIRGFQRSNSNWLWKNSVKLVDAADMLREAADTIEILRDRLQESYDQVPEQGERDDGGERESCGEVCGDDRFELIGKAKTKLLECTNIESRPEEVAVLDSILFRCWQIELLDQLRDDKSRWFQLFVTPERAARTLLKFNPLACSYCALYSTCGDDQDKDCLLCDYDALLEWLRGDA